MGYELSICVAPTKKITDNNDGELNQVPSVEISEVLDFGNKSDGIYIVLQTAINTDWFHISSLCLR